MKIGNTASQTKFKQWQNTFINGTVSRYPLKALLFSDAMKWVKWWSVPVFSIPVRFFLRFFYVPWMHCKDTKPKLETNIPRKGITRPQSQFPHSCVCERFIYSHDGSAYSAAGKYVDRSWEYINRSQPHECGIWDWCRASSFLGLHKWHSVAVCSASRNVLVPSLLSPCRRDTTTGWQPWTVPPPPPPIICIISWLLYVQYVLVV